MKTTRLINFGLLGLAGLAVNGCGGSGGTAPHAEVEFVYVSTFGALQQFRVSSTGQLVPLSPATVPTPSSAGVAATSDSKYMYVTNEADNSVSQFSIGADGTLTSIGANVPTGQEPLSVVISPDDKFVYVVNDADSNISEYSIGLTGLLTPLATPTIPASHDAFQAGISPNGKYLYVACNTGNKLNGYSIGVDGQLTALAVPTYNIGAPYAAVFSPDGTRLSVPVNNTSITTYTVLSDGSLGAPISTPTTNAQPLGFTYSINGQFAYASCFEGGVAGTQVSQYSVVNGNLVPLTPASATAGTGAYFGAADLSGQFLFVANNAGGTVSEFSIGSTGGLTALTPSSVVAANAFHIAFAIK